MTLLPIPAVSHIDVVPEGGALVVATEQLSRLMTTHLHNAARAAGGEGTLARVEPPEGDKPTRVLVWRTDMRPSQLANLLIEGLDAKLSINMVPYTGTLASPHQAGHWVTGVGIAFLTPQDKAGLERLTEHFRNGFELVGMEEVTVAHREGQFFVLRCVGALNFGLLQGRSSFDLIGESAGVNQALSTQVDEIGTEDETVKSMAERIRRHLPTI